MTIEYFKKEVYGNTMFYVKDKEQREKIESLTGRRTINDTDIKALEFLGHTLTQVLAD